MGKTAPMAAAWQPRFVLDLGTARGAAFEEVVAGIDKMRQESGPLPPLSLTDGWHTITPQIAEELLLRNPLGANRKMALSTVVYYAAQMLRGDWPKTGQPLIFKANGDLADGQNRLCAGYLSGASFDTYVVTNVPEHARLFAYIDNGKVRSAANALQTSGMNGVSPLIVKVLDAAYAYENDLFTVNSVQKRERMSPSQYLDSLEAHPTARTAAKLAVSDFSEASELADREVVAFAVMAITDLHGEDVTERFFNELGGVEATDEDGAVEALRKLLKKDADKLTAQMKRHQKLGNVIKAFNLWIAGEKPKKNWSLRVDENYPRFALPTEDHLSEAA